MFHHSWHENPRKAKGEGLVQGRIKHKTTLAFQESEQTPTGKQNPGGKWSPEGMAQQESGDRDFSSQRKEARRTILKALEEKNYEHRILSPGKRLTTGPLRGRRTVSAAPVSGPHRTHCQS